MCPVLVAGSNVALMKPAQISSIESRLPWANGAAAVDGNKATEFYDRSCTHTKDYPAEDKPWWRVDLGQAYHVHTVQLTNRLSEYVCWSRTTQRGN